MDPERIPSRSKIDQTVPPQIYSDGSRIDLECSVTVKVQTDFS